MRKSPIFLICVFLFPIIPNNGFADAPNTKALEQAGTPQSYETYKQLVKDQCDNSERPWNDLTEGGTLVAPPTYPEFTATAVNTHITQAIAQDKSGKLSQELDPNKIGNFNGIKSLEIARIEYRESMNNLFACAVIDSRKQILSDLQKQIQTKFPASNNELKMQFDKEVKRLAELRKTMVGCKSEKDSTIPTETQIKNTATVQFCHFNYYLLYLQSQLQSNNAQFMKIESTIGTGSGTTIAENTEAWDRELRKRQNQIQDEIARAKDTLPRAIRTFQEMKTTYPIHIMLTIIYDDYVRLRGNLSRYLNANSQLFEKMYNAQDANKS